MTKRKFLSDISISTAQAILNQFSGIVVFFIISRYLDKNIFGQVNWTLAMLMLVFSILGFGLEQLTVKKVAMGTDPALLLPSYLFHVILMGSGFVILAVLIANRFPILNIGGQMFILLALSQCLSFFATPFRQIANGLEKFSSFFIMSCTANILKVVLLLFLAFMQKVSLEMIMYVYLLSSFTELVVCALVFRIRFNIPIIPRYDGNKYFSFIKEALPQFGITVCNTALQRMDWILLGVLSTSVALAEYSFTNKLFELLLLPLLMIAPVLFPMVVKAVGNTHQHAIHRLKTIVKIEVMVAVLIALVANACWKDVIDLVTAEKYGSSTSTLILIMSFAMPLAYINNFFWSIHFAKGNMRTIFGCIVVTFLVNITLDGILIPYFGAVGAAVGFVLANVVQVFYYSVKSDVLNKGHFLFHTLLVYVNGVTAGFLSSYFFSDPIPKTMVSIAVYSMLLIITGQLRINDWISTKKITVV